jgi:hypothetical protein
MFRNRRARSIENATLRVTVLEEGGHIAEILDKSSGLNPLWIPGWPSIEPSQYDAGTDTIYGNNAESSLLSGIMGHNLCLDIFGGPSAEEAAAGMPVHGEASVTRFEIDASGTALVMHALLPAAQLHVERRIEVVDRSVHIRESIENASAADRPVGWTQHVTLGPPFLEKGKTQFRTSASRSKVFESAVGADDYLEKGAEFDWPFAPRQGGGLADLRLCGDAQKSSAYTAHLMDPTREEAFFVAFSPSARLAFGYLWRRADFPWMGIWEENCSRPATPWNGRTLTRGFEFGVSPMPETRRQMIERGPLFGVPTYRWIPARQRVTVDYRATVRPADVVPEALV